MALVKCKECGNEISKAAKQCPKCGAPIKKTTFLTWVATILIFTYMYLYFFEFDQKKDISVGGGSTYTKNNNSNLIPKPVPSINQKAPAINNIGFNFTSTKGGFGAVMSITFILENKNSFDIKDITIECEYFGKSGTKIDSSIKTIYDIFKGFTATIVKSFNMGFVQSQVNSTSCKIKDIVIIDQMKQDRLDPARAAETIKKIDFHQINSATSKEDLLGNADPNGNIMGITFIIKNNNDFDIKDIILTCIQLPKEGESVLGNNILKIHDIIKANNKKNFIKFIVGTVNPQSVFIGCYITDVSKI